MPIYTYPIYLSINHEELSGTIKIIPIISLEAFMMRNMRLSPVDSQEVHYYRPGNPSGSYTDMERRARVK